MGHGGCLKSPANSNCTESPNIGFTPAWRLTRSLDRPLSLAGGKGSSLGSAQPARDIVLCPVSEAAAGGTVSGSVFAVRLGCLRAA